MTNRPPPVAKANRPTHIILITKEFCNLCVKARLMLDKLRAEVPGISIQEIEFASPEGMDLAVKHRLLYPPIVFINGLIFAEGKIEDGPLRDAVTKAARSS